MIKSRIKCIVFLGFIATVGAANAETMSLKNIYRAPMEIDFIQVVNPETNEKPDWVDLKIAARLPRWNKPKIDTQPGILLGGSLSPSPGSLSYALTFLRGNQIFACRTRSDADTGRCVPITTVDENGYLNTDKIDAYYSKFRTSLEQKIFCTLIPICTPYSFDFINIEYSPK